MVFSRSVKNNLRFSSRVRNRNLKHVKDILDGRKNDRYVNTAWGWVEVEKKPKRYPKPDYDRCNAGHKLVEVYDEKRNAFIWDCPTCIRKMQEA